MRLNQHCSPNRYIEINEVDICCISDTGINKRSGVDDSATFNVNWMKVRCVTKFDCHLRLISYNVALR